MDFNFFRRKKENNLNLFQLEPSQIIVPQPQRFNNVEFCFQFDDENPQVFGTGGEEFTMTIKPQVDGVITFQHEGKKFKIFARETQQ